MNNSPEILKDLMSLARTVLSEEKFDESGALDVWRLLVRHMYTMNPMSADRATMRDLATHLITRVETHWTSDLQVV